MKTLNLSINGVKTLMKRKSLVFLYPKILFVNFLERVFLLRVKLGVSLAY